jgi:superfamily II DNA or RNA helicase
VRALIADLILGEPPEAQIIGQITLHDHQLSALRRLNEALERFNGAMLCDEVGMGKTYVAIAVARPFKSALVAAPAALVPMWRSALERTAFHADIVTFEALSRTDVDASRGKRRLQGLHDVVIVDEAHHVRNPRTTRYFALEQLVRGARVLLLTATPIHNRRHDLVALLSLFLGSRAQSMTAAELSHCIIRREQRQLDKSVQVPTVRPAVNHTVSDEPAIVEALMNLPPPVPVRDGGNSGALVGRGLVHQWASSGAALGEALRRRIARATALCVSLEAGTYPTLKELERWVYDDGALQLGFAELLSSEVAGHADLLDSLRAHLARLQSVKQRFNSSRLDAERTEIVRGVCQADSDAKIVAFSQYAETIAMLYRQLVKDGYVAMLTSHGARVAGGPLSRGEAIARFAPAATGSRSPPRAEAIHLLLTTDLLSEGVNLQDADTVIHLDVPWTAARLEQRVGRLARLGSRHSEVHVHVIRPPASAAAVLKAEPTVERKQSIARAGENLPRNVERLRSLLDTWRTQPRRRTIDGKSPAIGAAMAEKAGFIALVTFDGVTQLLVANEGVVTTDLNTQLLVCTTAALDDCPIDESAALDAIASIAHWCAIQCAASAAGVVESRALRRRALIARIDQSIETAPPQQRSARLTLAARARNVVTATQCAQVERELEMLLHAELEETKWLAAVANLTTQQAISQSAEESVRIHAILLLSLKPPRSPQQHDPEYP